MRDQRFQCIGCNRLSPGTDEDSSLISSKYGWRIVRRMGSDGQSTVDARCPQCWAAFRAMKPRREAG
jgi:hypothetical protein